MYEKIFNRQWDLKRHLNAPLFDERRRYLENCNLQGCTKGTLKIYAQRLLWITERFETELKSKKK